MGDIQISSQFAKCFISWKLFTLRYHLFHVHFCLWPCLNLVGVSTLTNMLRLLDKTANYYSANSSLSSTRKLNIRNQRRMIENRINTALVVMKDITVFFWDGNSSLDLKSCHYLGAAEKKLYNCPSLYSVLPQIHHCFPQCPVRRDTAALCQHQHMRLVTGKWGKEPW